MAWPCRSAWCRRPASPASRSAAASGGWRGSTGSPSTTSSRFEMVTADGQVLTASADQHPDLFWALRGGGGNFGVVTSFEYRAHPVSTVLGGLLLHPRSQATDLLKFYREFTASAPDELGTYAVLLSAPDGTPIAAIATCYCGDVAAGRASARAAARLRLADARCHPADAVSRHADAARRRRCRRQPELLEVDVHPRGERRGDRDRSSATPTTGCRR